MNDDVKKALEWLRGLSQSEKAWKRNHAAAILAHIDGEPARLAAAREEQREADAQAATFEEVEVDMGDGTTEVHDVEVSNEEVVRRIRATPLTATPRADRIAELERERDTARTERDAWKGTAKIDGTRIAFLKKVLEKVRSQRDASRGKRDALKAQLADAEKLNAHYVSRIRELQEADAMTLLNEAVKMLRRVTEALEGSFPGDESVEFPEVSLDQAWARRLEARAFLAKVKP